MTQIIQQIEAIRPLIREHSAEAEAQGRLSDDVVQAMRDRGLYHMAAPAKLGGLELSPLEIAEAIEHISAIDSAAGWALTNTTGCQVLVGHCPDDGIAELLGDQPLPIITGSINAPLQSTPRGDGYQVRGRGTFVSNFREADYILMMTTPEKVGDDEVPRIVLVPTSACRVIQEWNGFGMRGTGSVSVEVGEIVIPANQTYLYRGGAPFSSHHQNDLYRFPVIAHCASTFAAVGLGVNRRALAAIKSLVTSKVAFGDQTPLVERESTHAILGEAEALYRSARHGIHGSTREMWQRVRSGPAITPEDKARSLLDAVQATRHCAASVQLIFDLAGSDTMQSPNEFERCLRDIELIKGHGYFSWRRYASGGKALLGLQSEFAMIYL